MSRINKSPDFLAMSQQLIKDLQSDAEKQGMDFIHNNFYQEGFTDAAFEAWLPKKESDTYNILRVTNYLFNSVHVASSTQDKVVFEADAPYAAIHNEGGILNIPITERSRKFFWVMFKATGNEKWKWMALTKKDRFTIKIDKRQYMGDSETFTRDWDAHVINEIITRFKQL
ncbi:phage virion morphogenesis protein [Yeosuana marina]|uniref:phage virion morphogenesis protein n=1 Tax=Yeosuana marina TaxID=1565536 RepID=UPI0014241A53|nr:phage virion morphogenesis protein [Yeosuana marina]